MTKPLRRFLTALIAAAIVLLLGAGMLTQPLVNPIASHPPPVDEARLEAHVRMLSRTIYPRSFDQPDKLEAAASYVHAELLKASARVEDQFFDVEGGRYRNVIGRYGPCNSGETIVIGAHYDSYGDASAGAKLAAGFDLSTHTPGADDNASGVAGLLELARLLAQSPPPTCVELVGYTLAESHFLTESMGSVVHARSLRKARRPVTLMLSLEMIGYFSAQENSQTYPLPGLYLLYTGRGDFIGIVGRFADWAATRKVKAAMLGAADMPVRSMNAVAMIPGVDFSDHRSFWEEGVTALMITDTAFYRYPHYHAAGDTFDRLDYRRMAKVVQGVFAVIQSY